MKFLHTADWQIGARFRQFGDAGPALRAARLRTLRRALEHAAAARLDGFLVAGDLFEDNEVESVTVRAVFELLSGFPELPVFLLPGNHDPISGPGSLWRRPPFADPPPQVKVFREAEAVPLGEGWLVANPLRQKKSTVDPTLVLAEMATRLPAGAIKVGMTHGAPMLGRFSPDDFPIALDAASRAGLDFLALGHWHGCLSLDGGRMLMPGTPERTDFSESNVGLVHEVEIGRAGELPSVKAIAVGELRWEERIVDLTHAEGSPRLPASAADVARIVLRGTAAPRLVEEWRVAWRDRLAGCLALDLRDETVPELTEGELQALRLEHPLLTEVLEDLEALGSGGGRRFSPAELAALAERVGCAPEELSPALLTAARRMLLHEFRESCASC